MMFLMASRRAHPEGYGYSRFCELFRAWEGRLSPTMRQSHVVGEKLFVDYAGTTLDVIDGTTGEVLAAQLFVAALGGSCDSNALGQSCRYPRLPRYAGAD
jgi:transposase